MGTTMRCLSDIPREKSKYMAFGPLVDRASAARIVEFADSLISEGGSSLLGFCRTRPSDSTWPTSFPGVLTAN